MEDGGVRKEPCRYADRSPPDRAPHLPRYRRGGKASLHRANGHTLARRPQSGRRGHENRTCGRARRARLHADKRRATPARHARTRHRAGSTCARARRAHVVSRYPLPDRPAANTSPPCEIAECGCHHVHPRTRARAEKRRQGDLREGRPGLPRRRTRGHIHARDDWRALRPSTWHLQRALRQRGNWAPARRCAHVRHRRRRYGVGCVSPAHPAGQGVLRGRSARRGHRLRARARPGDGMRGRARLRADRG